MHYYGGNMMKTPLSGQTHPYRGTKPPKQPQRDQRPEPGNQYGQKAQAITKQVATESHISADKSVIRSKLWGGQMPRVKGSKAMQSSMQTTKPHRRRRNGALSAKHTRRVVPATISKTGQKPKNLLQGCGKPSSWQQKRRIAWLTPPAPKPRCALTRFAAFANHHALRRR